MVKDKKKKSVNERTYVELPRTPEYIHVHTDANTRGGKYQLKAGLLY